MPISIHWSGILAAILSMRSVSSGSLFRAAAGVVGGYEMQKMITKRNKLLHRNMREHISVTECRCQSQLFIISTNICMGKNEVGDIRRQLYSPWNIRTDIMLTTEHTSVQYLVYRARPISLAYWKLDHREKREGLADVISIHSFVIIIHSSQL